MPQVTQTWQYTFSTATTEPPTGSQVRVNGPAPYDTATKLWVRTITNDSRDVSLSLTKLLVDSTLFLQDRDDASRHVFFRVTGPPVLKTDYVEVPVLWLEGTAALPTQTVEVVGTVQYGTPDPAPVTGWGTPGELAQWVEPTSLGDAGTTMVPDYAPANLVTLQQAKNHLRVAWAAGDPREDDLTLKLVAAQSMILEYVSRNEPGRTLAENWTTPENTHPNVQAAVLIELGELWRYRGDDSDFAGERQSRSGPEAPLAPAIVGLLKLFTDPVLT